MTGLTLDQLKVVLTDVVEALPPVEKAVVNALFWERLSIQQVAAVTQTSRRTVCRVRDRALERIRALVEDE